MSSIVKVHNLEGEVVREMPLPEAFSEEFRPDLIKLAVLAQASKRYQPYGPSKDSGMQTSAEGWGTGRGTARVPRMKNGRKAMRVPQAVGGRAAHPPKPEKILVKKINKATKRKALVSAISATALPSLMTSRGHIFDGELPVVVENDVEGLVLTKDVCETIRNLGMWKDVERAKAGRIIRAGKGKMRGRKYKRRKSLLVIVGEDRGILKASRNIEGVDAVTVENLNVGLLAPGTHPGRLTLWSESALEKLSEVK